MWDFPAQQQNAIVTPVINATVTLVTLRDNLYSYDTTITGWGVQLNIIAVLIVAMIAKIVIVVSMPR